MKNVAHLCSRSRSKTWNGEGWKKVVVCIVADGRKKCDPRVLNVLECLGVYQEGVAKNIVNEKPVQAHLYEVNRAEQRIVLFGIFKPSHHSGLSIPRRCPWTLSFASKVQIKAWFLCKYCFASKSIMRKKSIHIAGSSMPLAMCFNRTYVYYSTSALDLGTRPSIIYGKRLITTRQ